MRSQPSVGRRLGGLAVVAMLVSAWATAPAAGSIFVEVDTVEGSFLVELFDEDTPLTVANWLNYADDGDYDDTFFHRSAVRGDGLPFVIQGGGFAFDDGAFPIEQDDQVQNEPGFSNLRGTLAMAKLAPPDQGGPPDGGPDSATNQWFVNLSDNADILDDQNGGFTVFGRVLGDGMEVVDEIAALQRVNLGSPFNEMPVRNYSGGDVGAEHLVFINSITRINQLGDADNNGMVSGDDLATIAAEGVFGSVGEANGSLRGDANGDGMVTGADLIAVQQHFGEQMPGLIDTAPVRAADNAAPAVVGVAANPEPATAALVAFGVLCLLRRRPPR